MRVTDLLPWKPPRGSTPASRDEGDAVAALHNDVNRAFDDFFRWFPVPFPGVPAQMLDGASGMEADILETDNEVRIMAELPGMDEADIDVQVNDGTLVISGEKKTDRDVKEDGYILRERSFGRIERILPLPEGIDADAAQARFTRGVLTVTIPKTAETQVGGKHIPVRSN